MVQVNKSIICIFAVFLNYITAMLFYQVLRIPLFFDTIWTVVIVFLFGLVPGLFVQVGYNILNYFLWVSKNGWENLSFLYSVCGILIVVSTWFFARKKDEFKISALVSVLYLMLIVLVSSFFTILAGGLIDYFQYLHTGVLDQMNPIKKFTESFLRQRFSLLSSCILAQIPVSFLDRLIASFAGYGIFLAIKRFFASKIFFGDLNV